MPSLKRTGIVGAGTVTCSTSVRNRQSKRWGALATLLACGCARITTVFLPGEDVPSGDMNARDLGATDASERPGTAFDAPGPSDADERDASTDWDSEVFSLDDVVTDRGPSVDLAEVADARSDGADGLDSIVPGPCFTPDYPDEGWDKGTCACLGASTESPGICRNPFALGACRRGMCLDGGTSSVGNLFCLSLDRRQGLDAECESRAFCLALHDLNSRSPRTTRVAECRYSDGTTFETGIIPVASCPSETNGLLCGRGCTVCGTGPAICWGFSEQNPLGACIFVSDDLPPCRLAAECPSGAGCLLPRNLDSLNRPAQGTCQPASHCRQIATAATSRFSCDQHVLRP
jgi:hypothetical protein